MTTALTTAWSAVYREPLAGPVAPDGVRLRASLLPESVWGSNIRGLVSRTHWDALRIPVCDAAANRCEICGTACRPRRPDTHEKWTFTPAAGPRPGVQKLQKLIALCRDCHRVQHSGLARVRGEQFLVQSHLQRVNQWSAHQASDDIDRAAALGELLRHEPWDLDLSTLQRRLAIPGYPALRIPHTDRVHLGNSMSPHNPS